MGILHCIALHCIALHCIALHCIVLYCIVLHCTAMLECNSLAGLCAANMHRPALVYVVYVYTNLYLDTSLYVLAFDAID